LSQIFFDFVERERKPLFLGFETLVELQEELEGKRVLFKFTLKCKIQKNKEKSKHTFFWSFWRFNGFISFLIFFLKKRERKKRKKKKEI